MKGLDTETTGLDIYHGAKPFYVGFALENGENLWWEWNVDPKTRQPIIPKKDIDAIQAEMDCWLVLHNAKFDVAALRSIGITWTKHHWKHCYDTLIGSHLECSNDRHDLTSAALLSLDVNIAPYEDRLKEAVLEARKIVKKRYPDWRVAKEGLPEMPSVKGQTWPNDMWLPRAVARYESYPRNHPWWDVLSEYSNADSTTTLALFKVQREFFKREGLWEIYKERMKVVPIVSEIQNNGVTLSSLRRNELETRFEEEVSRCKNRCMNAADNEIEKLPVNGVSNDLKKIVFDKFGLVSSKKTPTGNPSLDKSVLESWMISLPRKSKAYHFVKNLREYRKRATSLGYLQSYKKFWLHEGTEWYIIHPSLNPTGTDTLRFSSQNPNSQQISKQEGFNLRYCFGPAPGREWWSLDAKNIELRLPAYEAGETEMIQLFERPDDPPYFGSYHMLIFDTLHPKMFAEHGMDCKKVYASSWYQWTKNGDFAVQYGAVEQSGTADRAYHVEGAQHRIQNRFKQIKQLNRKMIQMANSEGFVETIPDRTVCESRGYPLFCRRTNRGNVLPTIPLNYHVQGTAMWWMMKAMIRVQEYLDMLNVGKVADRKVRMIMQVHDELVFDFPKRVRNGKPLNLPKIKKVQQLMEEGGNDIGIPTPVSLEYHPETWSESLPV